MYTSNYCFLTLLVCEMSAIVVCAFFGIAFLWDWNENWPCPVLWPLLSFQICWHIECSTFTASSFRIWNSSTEIPSPLALFVVMLPKAHLSSHPRMSGSRWVITPSWLSGSWRSFLRSSSVYFCHLFWISSASVRSIPFLFFILPIFAWNASLVSLTFLKKSLVFPILLSYSISLHWLLRKAFLSLLAMLWNSAFKWSCSLEEKLWPHRQCIKKQRITLPTKVCLVKAMVFPGVTYVKVGLQKKLSAKELMLLNCGVGKDSWESLGMQGDPTSPS